MLICAHKEIFVILRIKEESETEHILAIKK